MAVVPGGFMVHTMRIQPRRVAADQASDLRRADERIEAWATPTAQLLADRGGRAGLAPVGRLGFVWCCRLFHGNGDPHPNWLTMTEEPVQFNHHLVFAPGTDLVSSLSPSLPLAKAPLCC